MVELQRTKLRSGDPCYVSFVIANCPLCNADFVLMETGWTQSGHVKTPLGERLEHVIFGACTKHFEEAMAALVKRGGNNFSGYVGEWEPKLGLMAEVSIETHAGLEHERVRII